MLCYLGVWVCQASILWLQACSISQGYFQGLLPKYPLPVSVLVGLFASSASSKTHLASILPRFVCFFTSTNLCAVMLSPTGWLFGYNSLPSNYLCQVLLLCLLIPSHVLISSKSWDFLPLATEAVIFFFCCFRLMLLPRHCLILLLHALPYMR